MGYGDAQPDYGYGDAQPDRKCGNDDAPPSHSMVYSDDAQPFDRCLHHGRRFSMSDAQQTHKRASIKAILADRTKSPMAKRRAIQHLMDGHQHARNNKSMITSTTSPSAGCGDAQQPEDTRDDDTQPDYYGYGDSTMSNNNAQVMHRRATIAIMASNKAPSSKRRSIQYINVSLAIRRNSTTA